VERNLNIDLGAPLRASSTKSSDEWSAPRRTTGRRAIVYDQPPPAQAAPAASHNKCGFCRYSDSGGFSCRE
jgi:hypothetical protein